MVNIESIQYRNKFTLYWHLCQSNAGYFSSSIKDSDRRLRSYIYAYFRFPHFNIIIACFRKRMMSQCSWRAVPSTESCTVLLSLSASSVLQELATPSSPTLYPRSKYTNKLITKYVLVACVKSVSAL